MTRSSRTPQRLHVGGETYLWSVRHEHHGEESHYEDCQDVLTVRRPGALGRLELVFAAGRGHDAEPDRLDLHDPGTVHALLDEARLRGIPVSADSAEQFDGWPLLDTLAARRS